MTSISIRSIAGLPLFVSHVAAKLGASERTVRWWAATGQLRARRTGVKLWVFDEADVVAFARDRGLADGALRS